MTHNQRVLRLLSDGRPHTHHELYALHVIAHSRISDLRAMGHFIEQWREGDDYFYQLVTVQEGELASGGEPSGSPLGQSSSIRDCPPEPGSAVRVSPQVPALSSSGNGPAPPPRQLSVFEAAA